MISCLFLANLKGNQIKIIKDRYESNFYSYSTHSNRVFFILIGGAYIHILDDTGDIVHKFKYFVKHYHGDKGDIYELRYSSLSPNGKMLSITRGLFDTQSEHVYSGDIFLINLLGGKLKLTNTSDKIELVKGWSPEGNKIVYFELNSKKYFLMTIDRKK